MERNVKYHKPERIWTVYDPMVRSFKSGQGFSSLYGRDAIQDKRVQDSPYTTPDNKGDSSNFGKVLFIVITVCILLAVSGVGAWLAYSIAGDGKSVDNTDDTTTSTLPNPSTDETSQPTDTTTPVQHTTVTKAAITTESTQFTTEEVEVTTFVQETTTDQASTTQSPAISPSNSTDARTTTSISLEIRNPFTGLTDTDGVVYYIFVATSDNMTLLDENSTWGSVQNTNEDFAYVALICQTLSAESGCEPVTERRKRNADIEDTLLIKIGTDICDPEDPNVVCNGELLPGKEYFFLVRRKHIGSPFAQDMDSGFSAPISTIPLGIWDEWGTWSDCDVTCGGGLRRRSRPCVQYPPCQGLSTESERCSANACTFEVSAGSWQSWSAWSDCTYTCGGGEKLRTRMCNEGPEGEACEGDSRNIIECGTSPCPDCDVVCTSGHLNGDCTHCECYTTFIGTVKSTDNVPLSNVSLSMSDKPYYVLTTTGNKGQYTLEKLCLYQEILFYKPGYSSSVHNAGTLPNVVELEGEEPLLMDIHPRSKKRVVGDDVLFCCAAMGSPLPSFYEWFKNGIQIAGESGSTLSLTDLSLESAGSYRCRANTESKSIYSSEAILTVKASPDDFCPDTAEVKNQALPTGCLYNGSSVINVGSCARLRCRGDSVSNETCSDTETFCCAATEFQKINIPCDDFTFSVYKTIRCGCARCTDPVLDIQGFVFSALDNSPLEGVDIYFNKTIVSRTSRNGQFYFSVPQGTLRVAITAKPPNASEYADGISVVSLSDDADGVFYTLIKLAKVNVLPPMDSSQEQELSLKTNKSKELLIVEIPPDSFYDEDGNQVEGMVTPYVSTVDSTSVEDLETAPGDFTFTDANGESQPLKTYGMFSLGFKTASGSDAHLTGSVQIDIPATVFGTVTPEDEPNSRNPLSDIKLFTMTEAGGLWSEASDIYDGTFRKRRKRSQQTYTTTVAGLTLGKHWYNFDAVSDTTCYSKIRVFENDEFKEAEQRSGVTVFAMVKDDLDTYSFSTRLANDNNDANGFCIVHRCDKPENNGNGFEGYLVVQKNGKYLIPAVNNTKMDDLEIGYMPESNRLAVKFDMTKVPDNRGPFYDWNGKWWDSDTCINADFSHRHFRFHLHPEDQCDILTADEFDKAPGTECQPEYYKSWYSVKELLGEDYTSCYARVKIAHYTNRVRVLAVSRVGTMVYIGQTEIIKPGETYGSHENCVKGGVVCVRIKPSGTRSCSNRPLYDLSDKHTQVDITARYQYSEIHLNVSEVNIELMEENPVLQQNKKFSFEWEYAGSQEDHGIFCSSSSSKEESRLKAEEMCLDADDSIYAVQFGVSVNSKLLLLLVVDTSGSASSSQSEAKSFMLDLVSHFSIGSDNTLVALVTSEDPTCQSGLAQNSMAAKLEWGFSDDQTSTSDALQAAINGLVYDGRDCDLHPSTYEFISENVLGSNEGTPTVVVSVADGSHDRYSDTLDEAVASVAAKTNIMLAVGVGGYLSNVVYMNMIATTPQHVYSASQVSDVVSSINEAIG